MVWLSREAAGARLEPRDWGRVEPGDDVGGWCDVSGVVLACEHRFDDDALRRKVQFAKGAGLRVWVEVCSVEEAAVAADLGADGVVICGLEAGGLCGEESGLVLLGRVRGEVGVPAVVRGAMGPDTAAAVMVAGASGYVLEEALWLCEGMAPSSEAVKVLERVGATDTRCLGVVVGARYRAWSLLATRPTRELAAREIAYVDQEQEGGARAYLEEVRSRRFERWEAIDPKRELWPMGQGGALARVFRERYGSVGAAVRGVREHVMGVMGALVDDFPLAEGQGVARVNGTRLPIHQGPMAQVSDTPEFARAVVDAGALPWLALGNMPTDVACRVIGSTAQCLGDAPFGAGIIGLEANPYRDAHIDEMATMSRKRGNFLGLVAAGSAEQAMVLEGQGVPTYLHTPTPGVLEAALKQGQRRFIWEGSEAGGHVGTLGALALWQMGVIAVEEALASGVEPSEVAVVVAGGISSAASAAAAAAMLFGLHRCGVAVGIQMGTAYLMCREAVESGAVSRTYQEVARRSAGTVIMGESVNTPTRVLMSPAARRVLAREVERLKEGVKLSERKHLYERDNLGGLRAAAKSERIAEVLAEGGARFEQLSEEEQLESGLFHCGQGVRLCAADSIDALHWEVSEVARRWAQERWAWCQAPEQSEAIVSGARQSDARTVPGARPSGERIVPGARPSGEGMVSGARPSDEAMVPGARPSDEAMVASVSTRCQAIEQGEDLKSIQREGMTMVERKNGVMVDGDRAVAIVGIGAKMPGALSAAKFWENILFGVSAIKEVPADRWDPALYFDEDPNAPDKTYSKIGGWIEGFEFDRRRFRMPPRVVASVDPTQLLCLEAVHEALEDAGYLEKEFKRDRCAVILGNALGGDLRDDSTLRILYPKMDQALRGALMALSSSALSGAQREALLAEVEARFKGELGEVSEDSMPGELANVIAGRVAQVFDLRGPNFVTDAACASSLAAVEAGVRGLRSGEYDMVVCGGADRTMGPTSFVKFSKIGALSPDGSRPFDQGANGFVMGEGAGILVLKRLSDAIEYGDSIYAVIRGVGGSSDGKGKAITAPNPDGQRRALDRAYEDAGFGPRSVSLFEAHGTSTPVGDPTEVASLRAALGEDRGDWAAERVALGSVKSMIGHLKSAAGAAGMIKAAMALKHRVLPPTLGVERANPALELEGTRLKLQTEAQPWEVFDGQVRRAGVSAFGFGGTNFHVVLEEYRPGRSVPGARQPYMGAEVGSGARQPYMGAEAGSGARHSDMRGEPGSGARHSDMGGDLGSGARHSDMGGDLGSGARHSDMRGDLGSGARHSNEGVLGLSAASVGELEVVIDDVMERLARGGMVAVAPWCLPLDGEEAGERPGEVQEGVRLAVAFGDVQELQERLERAKRAATRKKGWKVLANQGIVLGESPVGGKLAMLFPGQGTQYLGMLSALKERFEVVRRTFEEADEVMMHVIGRRLSEVIDPGALEGAEAERAAFEALTQTEITQPAVLTADIALYRLLGELGIRPQMVAGHSLGEYGACVAAGIMSFADALRTVAARGTEMAKVTPMNGDTGLMAGVSAPVEVVQPVLDRIDGYVVCANINCPTQTIIAGLSEPVRQAVRLFEEMGLQAPLLPVSHAFHTEVVAAASGPLRRHLGNIEVRAPQVPILTNVTGGYYPSVAGCEDAIRDLLSEQVAAPVQFIRVIETMYAGGARAFVEVGPKRAQASFVGSILEGRPHLSLHTNHPKKGDVASLYEALAGMWAAGVWRPGEARVSDVEMPGHRADAVPGSRADEVPGSRADRVPGSRADEVPGSRADVVSGDATSPAVDRASIDAELMRVLCEQTGYEAEEIEVDYELEADLGVDTVKQAEIMAQVRELYGLERDESFRLSEYPTLRRMGDYVAERVGMMGDGAVPGHRTAAVPGSRAAAVPGHRAAAVPGSRAAAVPGHRADRVPGHRADVVPGHRTESRAATIDATPNNAGRAATFDHVDASALMEKDATPLDGVVPYQPARHAVAADVEISGCAVGLPGEGAIFRRHAIDELLAGKNMIGQVPVKAREAMVGNRIVRLQKHEGGGGEMRPVTDMAEVIKLAGLGDDFDLEEWGVPERLRASLDRTSQLAFAAGFEALRDAGLPLVPRYRETTTGKRVTTGWTLPEAVGRETGVIFASAFAGQDALIEELRAQASDDYQFNHRFLLLVLGIANSRFAEFVGARGPNTKINNACASTTTAVGMAQDWIRCGRCKRVLILSADEASGSTLMEWIGSGFLATGAATTESDVSRAALPFDRRRHGMIIGMGALSLVVEKAGLAEARGIEPIADVLATRFVNSAHHPTRLDVDHIAGEVSGLVDEVEQRFGVQRAVIADRTVFISHETYTPARGGSASAEIAALRRTFGEQSNRVVIANTKGFTGHAMAAGIEDVLAMKVLQRQVVPPIANFEEPDPELGDLRLSQGGSYPVDYALRLAAGFGSQLALALFRYRARREQRVFDPARYRRWLGEVSGAASYELEVASRVLRLRPVQPEDRPPGAREPHKGADAILPGLPMPAPGGVGGGAPAQAIKSSAEVFNGASATSMPAPDETRRPAPGLVAGAQNSSFAMRPVAIEAVGGEAIDVLRLQRELRHRVVALVGGPVLVAELFARTLRHFGAQVVRLASDRRRGPLDEAGVDLSDEAMLLAVFKERRVDAVINLLGVAGAQEDADEVYWAARQTFHVARAFEAYHADRVPGTAAEVQEAGVPGTAAEVQEAGVPGTAATFMSVTMMGGCFGLSPGSTPSVAGGAVSGFSKSLAREWEWARVKVVDVAGEEFDERLATEVVWELVEGRSDCEVGLAGGLSHRPVVLEASDLLETPNVHQAPGPDAVILVTGGGRGITAEVCVDLARRFKCALALVGRTPLTHPDPLRVDLKAERARIKEALKASGERATPVAVRQKLRPLEAQREIVTNLERMRDAGARAEYFSCDVADAGQVERLVAEVAARFGRVSGVIHGAGVEDSRLLADKDVQAFDRVFRGKAVGGVNLWRALGDRGLEFYVAFTSVAGRFGNAGQTDYAAANDALARQVMQINQVARRSGRALRALAIDWTAWDEVGMAVEGSMRTILEAKGVEFLPPEIGAPMVGESLERGLTGEFVVAGELGELGEDRVPGTRADHHENRVPEDRVPGTRADHCEDRVPGTVTSFALIDRVVTTGSDEVVVERIFDPQRDHFLSDHRYEGNELVPGVMGYELMSAAAMVLTGEPVAELREVRFERALKLAHSEPVRALATARVVGQQRGCARVEVRVSSERVVRTGRTVRQEHFRAEVLCGTPLAHELALSAWGAAEKSWCEGPDRDAIYQRFFHTGSFQLLSGEVWHHEDAILATGAISNHRLMAGMLAQRWVSDPLVRELGLQAVGLWGLMHHGRTYLPLGIGQSRMCGQASVGEPLLVRAHRRVDAAEGTIAFDVEVRGYDGRLLQVMERVEMVAHAPLDARDRLAPGKAATYLEVRLSAAEAQAMLDGLGGRLDEVLSAAELEGYERLRSAQRRGEWLAARLAAREAARCWALMFYGERIDSSAICVFKNASGEPQLRWRDGTSGGRRLPALSLTHTSGQAVAVVAMPGARCRLGVDLEPLEARSEAFGSAYFSAGERALAVGSLVAGQRETALWTVKEAVSKALGLGLQLSASEIEIVAVREDDVAAPGDRTGRVSAGRLRAAVEVVLHGQAHARQSELGVRAMEVELRVEGGFAQSVARAWGEDLRDLEVREPGTGARVREDQEARQPGTGAKPLSEEELAAVVALLRHRGVWGGSAEPEDRSSVMRQPVSPWKV
ncbi:type I polyketide synthase [Lujinxingia vulgaris]|uniref:type I polyketide synthase n=1 Tax=Lujinxingia vulgaris TaxID=2600176 RepID=UPI001E368271|nr:type I polyketide synthase [Lujinxingia vulgaris]